MTLQSVVNPFEQFTDAKGEALESGYIYIGTAGVNAVTNQISVYFDAALTIPAPQPIRTVGGYPAYQGNVATLYVDADDYSVVVQDKKQVLVYSSLNVNHRIPATLINYKQSGTGAIERSVSSKLAEFVSVKDFGAVGDGVTDDTAAIQAAIDSVPVGGGTVYLPAGLYLVDPATSIIVKSYLTIKGDGFAASQLLAKPVAGTVIKRAFAPAGPNEYVRYVGLEDFGIIFQHPATANPSNYYQVGFQMRHITRSWIDRCYVGNYPTGVSSGVVSEPASQEDARQGYGVSFGSTSSSDPAYAGGEVNSLKNSNIIGTRYGVVLDDATFDTPYGASAAYSTLIERSEVQIAEVGIAQYRSFGGGCTFANNTIQAIDNMRGSTDTRYSLYIGGYENLVYGGYNESANTDYELYLASSSKRNRILPWLSDDGVFSDNGTANVYEKINSSDNEYIVSVDGNNDRDRLVRAWVDFYWDGAAIVIRDSFNIATVARIGPGDYRIDFSAGVMDSANYAVSLSGSVNATAHRGILYVRTPSAQTAANCRILTYNLNNAAYEDFGLITAAFHAN